MKIGITGATGQLGRLVVEKLKERKNSLDLIALVRSPKKAADMGVEAKAFDYTQPDNMPEQLKDVDHLLLISSSEVGQRKAHHQHVIDAAKQAGVKWIVYTSLLHADSSPLSLAAEHVETERMLKESGIPHTILRNGWYTENYIASVPGAVQAGTFIGSASDGRIAFATREDYAEAAAVVLTGEGHVGKLYELAGDNAYTLADLAAEISKQTDKDIPYLNMSEADYSGALASAGLPDPVAAAFASFDTGAAKGGLFDDKKELSKLIGRPTTALSVAVQRALA